MANSKRNTPAILGMCGIFLFGAVTGAIALVGYTHHKLKAVHNRGPEVFHDIGVEFLDWELDLTEEQKVQTRTIINDFHRDLLVFKNEHSDHITLIVKAALDRLDSVLTSEQREAWAGTRMRFEEHAGLTDVGLLDEAD